MLAHIAVTNRVNFLKVKVGRKMGTIPPTPGPSFFLSFDVERYLGSARDDAPPFLMSQCENQSMRERAIGAACSATSEQIQRCLLTSLGRRALLRDPKQQRRGPA